MHGVRGGERARAWVSDEAIIAWATWQELAWSSYNHSRNDKALRMSLWQLHFKKTKTFHVLDAMHVGDSFSGYYQHDSICKKASASCFSGCLWTWVLILMQTFHKHCMSLQAKIVCNQSNHLWLIWFCSDIASCIEVVFRVGWAYCWWAEQKRTKHLWWQRLHKKLGSMVAALSRERG